MISGCHEMHPDSKFFTMINESNKEFRFRMESFLRNNNKEMWDKMDKITIDYYDSMMEVVEINNAYDLGYAHDGYGY